MILIWLGVSSTLLFFTLIGLQNSLIRYRERVVNSFELLRPTLLKRLELAQSFDLTELDESSRLPFKLLIEKLEAAGDQLIRVPLENEPKIQFYFVESQFLQTVDSIKSLSQNSLLLHSPIQGRPNTSSPEALCDVAIYHASAVSACGRIRSTSTERFRHGVNFGIGSKNYANNSYLLEQFESLEKEIEKIKRECNLAIESYNQSRCGFPNRWVSRLFGFYQIQNLRCL